MAVIFKIFGVLLIQTLLLNYVFAQYKIQNMPCGPQIRNAPYNPPQIKNAPYSQPQPLLINSLLSTYASNMPFVDKINTLAAVIQKLPPKSPGVTHKRIHMAEALKKTALESLMFAANACKCSKKAERRIPLPQRQMTAGNDVLANRVVNVRFDRYF